jgi:phosphoglycerate dehydrogenase-like enzyme
MPVGGLVNVLVASPLEAEHVARIESADRRLRLLYAPDLLPLPRYRCDHTGVPRDLPPAELDRWAQLRELADVSLDFDWQSPADMPKNCPRLVWVQATSAGIGGFLERTGLADTDLVFTTAAGVHATPLAEFVLYGLLHFVKEMPVLARWQREQHWERHTSGVLAGSTAVVVGLGNIGREVCRLLSAVGVTVYGCGRPGRTYQVPGVARYTDTDRLREVLPKANALILTCPLTAATAGLIGPAELAALPRRAVVVNVGRGALIDEPALVSALAAGRLAGACLDVFATEPLPLSSPLWAMDNVIVSPHSAATAAAENSLLTDLFIDNLRRWLAGEPLRNVYDREAGY